MIDPRVQEAILAELDKAVDAYRQSRQHRDETWAALRQARGRFDAATKALYQEVTGEDLSTPKMSDTPSPIKRHKKP